MTQSTNSSTLLNVIYGSHGNQIEHLLAQAIFTPHIRPKAAI